MLNWSWGLYLASGFVFGIGVGISRIRLANVTASQLLQTQRAGFWISIAGCVSYLVACVLTAIIAWRISQPAD